MDSKQKKTLIGFILLLVVGVLIVITTRTLSLLSNDTRVEENSELIYYIDVTYDGIDQESNVSSDSNQLKIYSGLIDVYDKIPEGLEFERFLGVRGSSINAEPRSGSYYCSGNVIDGYNGLYYDDNTRTISFQVNYLQAGCKISVGVVTSTGSLGSADRIDYYNTAYAREKNATSSSNVVHAYVGSEMASFNTVTYSYTGQVPSNASAVPIAKSYVSGSPVGVEADAYAMGYTFSGWTTSDVTVTEGAFEMPNRNITFTGSFTENPKYKVTYEIVGEKPSNYAVPSEKYYRVGEVVTIDNLYTGSSLGSYYFSGWDTLDSINGLSYNTFEMPDHNVTFRGEFEKATYQLCFEFDGYNVPPILPPDCVYYAVGDEVDLPEVIAPEGYKFVGWNVNTPYIMGEYDTSLYGTFMYYNGSFRPDLSNTLDSDKEIFSNGDEVNFNITVTNNESYPLYEVMVRETSPCYFKEGDNYQLKSDTFALISQINPNETITLTAQCVAGNDVVGTYVNTVNIVGGLTEDDYYLDLDTPIVRTATYNVGNVSLTIINKNKDGSNIAASSEFELFSDPELTNSVGTGLSYVGLAPGTYYLKQNKVGEGYQILKEVVEINVSSTGVVTSPSQSIIGNDGVYQLIIVNKGINLLPETGGTGAILFTIIGLLIATLGSIYYIKKKKGNKR